MSDGPLLFSQGGWIRRLSDDEQDFADWAGSRGMRAMFEFFPKEVVVVSLTIEERVGGQVVAWALDVGDLPLGPQIMIRDYLEQRLRREHQALKDSL